jgi:hypothetical protein
VKAQKDELRHRTPETAGGREKETATSLGNQEIGPSEKKIISVNSVLSPSCDLLFTIFKL